MQNVLNLLFTIIAIIALAQNNIFCQADSGIVFEEPDKQSKSINKSADYPHKLGLFVGGAEASYNDEAGLAFGLNYRLKVMELLGPESRKWNIVGAGINIENNLHANTELAVSAGAILFLSNKLWFYLYPGMRYFFEKQKFIRSSETFDEKMFWRIGASYDFLFRGIIISPSIYSDIIDDESSYTFGISFLYRIE